MKRIRKNSHAIAAIGLFIGWYADSPAPAGIRTFATRNALKATPVERLKIGRKLAEKVSPEALAEDRRLAPTERIAVRPRGPWGSGQGVMILDTCEIAESGTVTLTGHDTRGHSFTRTYPRGIHRVGFRVFAVERL